MRNIFDDHKKKVRAEKRDFNRGNFKTFTPPNQGQKETPNLFVQDASNDQYRTSSDPEIAHSGQPLIIAEAQGPHGPEFETQTQQEEFQVEEATKSICAGFNMQSCVLLIALCFHAVFEGIALGLTNELSATINIMVALGLHKPAAALSLGVSLTKNFKDKNDGKKAIFLLTVFAAATPVGIMLGMALQHSSPIVEVIFNSIAGGTFLYIAASEVIVEEFSMPDRYKWAQYGAFLCGICLISCLWFMEV